MYSEISWACAFLLRFFIRYARKKKKLSLSKLETQKKVLHEKAWKCKYYRPRDQPTADQPTDRPTDSHEGS